MPFHKIKDVMRIIKGSAQAVEEPLEPFIEYFPPQPRGQAIIPGEVGEMLEGIFEEDVLCICGKKMEIVDVDAWGVDNAECRMIGVFSCASPGCSGNHKEYCEKYLAAMRKLTDDEKKLLHLWNWDYPKNSVDVATHLP